MNTPTEEICKEVLRGAADHLEQHGWQQFAYGRRGGPCCALGAIACAAEIVGRRKNLGFAITWTEHATNLFRDKAEIENVSSWNDAEGRTKEEVVAALRKAAA